MNKIIILLGLFVSFISVIFFTMAEMSLVQIAVKAVIVFFSVTILLSIISLVFLKMVNKTIETKKQN